MSQDVVTNSQLGLKFDLSTEFCSAVWNALNDPIEAAIAATGQKYDGQNLVHLHVTEPLRNVFSNIVWRASHKQAEQSGQVFPQELHDYHKQSLLIARCINYGHGAVAHMYDSIAPYDVYERAAL